MKSIASWAWAMAAVISVISIGKSAFAGKRISAPVVVLSTQAGGGFGSARNASTDPADKSNVGCTLTYQPNNFPTITCSATTSTGANKMCSTTVSATTPALLALSSLKDDSYLLFTWDSAGHCKDIIVTNSSTYEPKVP